MAVNDSEASCNDLFRLALLSFSMKLNWQTSDWVSCLHAAEACLQAPARVDPRLAQDESRRFLADLARSTERLPDGAPRKTAGR